MSICSNISRGAEGRLHFAGQSVYRLAKKNGTPLYLMDEDRIRHNCRVYREAFEQSFRPGSTVLYASKANAFRDIYRIVGSEGLGADAVSVGELHTAASAGFDMSRVYFHGNSKTPEDVAFAMDLGVGYFVIDNAQEIDLIEREAADRGIRQKALLRVTPGIDPHTYEAVSTGKVDSKFGTAIETGQAEETLRHALEQQHIDLRGLHCHVGSQVFWEDVFERSVVVMLQFMAEMRDRCGFVAEQLNLGGGYGVRYVESDPPVHIGEKIASVGETLHRACFEMDYPEPMILMEPGRSIIADAGMTVYTVGSTRSITGYKNYISVDGGMSDNPRYALYGSKYTVLLERREGQPGDPRWDVVGRCCESGDVIQPDVVLPTPECGELLAVCTTGAYNYSMASNYNRFPRPPIVMLHDGTDRISVRRETLDDLIRLDV